MDRRSVHAAMRVLYVSSRSVRHPRRAVDAAAVSFGDDGHELCAHAPGSAFGLDVAVRDGRAAGDGTS